MWEVLHEKEGGVANYYIADLHLGHENVIRFDNRPFANLEEMHRTIIDIHEFQANRHKAWNAGPALS